MQLAYLSGNGDTCTFSVNGTNYTVSDKSYQTITISDGTTISATINQKGGNEISAGQASFNNSDTCLSTQQISAPTFYLQQIKAAG